MHKYKAGNLVWVHIGGGYGWWPCQVMEPKHAAKDKRKKVMQLKRDGYVLVHCHGDQTFNWFPPRDVEPIAKAFDLRAAQKHKRQDVKTFFKLALQEVKEIQDMRAGRTPSTTHFSVDFTRPDTYEHLLGDHEVPSEELEPEEEMAYPAAATKADADAADGRALLAWLQQAAKGPEGDCQALCKHPPAAATTAAMRMLWSHAHNTAVQQHGAGAFSGKPGKRGKPQQHRRSSATDAAADTLLQLHKQSSGADAGEDGAAAPSKSKQQEQEQHKAGSKAAAAAAAGAKRKGTGEGARAGKKARASRTADEPQNQDGQQQQEVDPAAAAAAAGRPGKGSKDAAEVKVKKPRQSKAAAVAAVAAAAAEDAAAAAARGAAAAEDAAAGDDTEEAALLREEDHLDRYGGTIPNASIRKAAQLLRLAAVAPEPIATRMTAGQGKAIALLMRWREAVMARSNCRLEGEVGPILRGALERVNAIPIRPPPPAPKVAAAAAGAVGVGGAAAAGVKVKMEEDIDQLAIDQLAVEALGIGDATSSGAQSAGEQEDGDGEGEGAVRGSSGAKCRKRAAAGAAAGSSGDEGKEEEGEFGGSAQRQQKQQRLQQQQQQRVKVKAEPGADSDADAGSEGQDEGAAAAAGGSAQRQQKQQRLQQQQQQQQRVKVKPEPGVDSDADAGSEGPGEGAAAAGRGAAAGGGSSTAAAAASRAAATAATKKGALASYEAARGSKEQRSEVMQRIAVKQEQQQVHSEGGDGSRQQHKPAGSGGAASGGSAGGSGGGGGGTNLITVHVKQYGDRIGSKETFISDLLRWAGGREQPWQPGKVGRRELAIGDLYSLFMLVAEKGGYDAVCARKAWTGIAKSWHAQVFKGNKANHVRTAYIKALLAYENHISSGCPVVTKKFRVAAGAVGGAGQQREQGGTSWGPGRAAAVGAAAAAGQGRSQQQQRRQGDWDDDDDDTEAGLTPHEAKLARAYAAAASPSGHPSGQPGPSGPSGPTRQPGSSSQEDKLDHNRRRMLLRFEQGHKLPPLLTVLNAGKRFEADLEAGAIKIHDAKAEITVTFSSAGTAVASVAQLHTYWRSALRVREGEQLKAELVGVKARPEKLQHPRSRGGDRPSADRERGSYGGQRGGRLLDKQQQQQPKGKQRVHERDVRDHHHHGDYHHDSRGPDYPRGAGERGERDGSFPGGEAYPPGPPHMRGLQLPLPPPLPPPLPHLQQQQQQPGYLPPPPAGGGGPRPMVSQAAAAAAAAAAAGGASLTPGPHPSSMALPGGIVLVPAVAPQLMGPLGGSGGAAAAAAGGLPGLGAAASGPVHVLVDPRRQHQQQHMHTQPSAGSAAAAAVPQVSAAPAAAVQVSVAPAAGAAVLPAGAEGAPAAPQPGAAAIPTFDFTQLDLEALQQHISKVQSSSQPPQAQQQLQLLPPQPQMQQEDQSRAAILGLQLEGLLTALGTKGQAGSS